MGKCSWKITLLLPLSCLLALLPVRAVAAAELPPLIQSTTIAEDHLARLSLALTGTVRMTEANIEKAYEKVLSGCVRIQVNGHYGSGSIYRMTEQEVIIASNRHVLQYWDEDSYIIFMNGACAPGRFLGTSDTADVGFVAVSIEDIGYELLWFLHTVREAEPERAEKLEEGTPYFAVDMASDWQEPVCYEGTVADAGIWLEAFGMPMLLGKGTAVPGMSGGGVFDAYGNYLGMLTGGSEEGMIAAVPVSEIDAVYEEIEYRNK